MIVARFESLLWKDIEFWYMALDKRCEEMKYFNGLFVNNNFPTTKFPPDTPEFSTIL
jgi:hypothetical protein